MAIKRNLKNKVNGTVNGNGIAKRGRKPLTEAEKAPDARFDRVIGKRAMRAYKLIIGLRAAPRNPSMYSYTPDQVEFLFGELDKAMRIARKAYASPENKPNGKPATVESIFRGMRTK